MSASIPSARRVLLEGGSPDEEALFLLLPSGAYKTTLAGRLVDLDARVADLISAPEIGLLDLGVSSGVTTVELIEALEAQRVKCRAVAADLVIHARLAHVPLLGEVLVDGAGKFLQSAGRFGVRMRPYPRGARVPAAKALDMLARGCSRGGTRGTPVQLVTKRLASRKGCQLVEHDVFSDRPEWHESFHIVRAANLLNLSYFPPDDIRHATRLLRGFLSRRGLLVLCRTDIDTGRNDATILRRVGDGFEVAVRLGEGSEVEELAVSSGRRRPRAVLRRATRPSRSNRGSPCLRRGRPRGVPGPRVVRPQRCRRCRRRNLVRNCSIVARSHRRSYLARTRR